MTPNETIKRVIVEEGAGQFDLTHKILGRIHTGEIKNGVQWKNLHARDKETLRLIQFPGEMLKPCPGTTQYICCGYWILHGATNCPLDCSYCILQAYLNDNKLSVFVNIEDKLESIYVIIKSHPERLFRIGTGEFSDSLALDPIVGWNEIFLPKFSTLKNAVLEFKTKTDTIKGLITSPFRDRIIVSWSLNSPYIASREEHGAPSIKRRLEAARKCQEEGYVLGFHFDPIIEHPRWQDEYKRTIEMMDAYIKPKGIIWISLGSLRFMPSLKPIIRKRHPGSHILDGEFVKALDGKMRYLKSIRIELYGMMKEMLDQWNPDLGVYLCMESNEVWTKGLGWSVKNSDGLSRYLDSRVYRFFGN